MSEVHTYQEAVETRPSVPRIFKKLRQRARVRFEADLKARSARRQTGREEMAEVMLDGIPPDMQDPQWDYQDRPTLCLPSFAQESILHAGDEGFKDVLRQYFPSAESNATERLVDLKSRLRNASTHDFWSILMEGMCDITGSQCGFVAKRMLVDDQDSAVEMPELGEPGSCLMGVAFYINNGSAVKELYRDYRYTAYGTPCAHMKHDKVFIVPERMQEVVTNNPNKMPWDKSESFIGVPLFHDGKCFAHFGMVWSSEGASRRKLGWNFIEMFMHSLEDMILLRMLEGRGFAKKAAAPESTQTKIIPLSAISASQSLKPYARSLSHELRTPMQGVVGMLDIMYSTVLDAISSEQSERVRSVFKDLKTSIEVVQDSSKRAVEAADNVVHAYDMNMQMPETPLTPAEPTSGFPSRGHSPERGPETSSSRGKKRAPSEDIAFHSGPPLKRMFSMTEAEIVKLYCTGDPAAAVAAGLLTPGTEVPEPVERRQSPGSDFPLLAPTQRRIVTRDFLRNLLIEALRSGHPTKEVHTDTALGEQIEVQTTSSRGEIQNMIVNLEVADDVPEFVITEENHLQFCTRKIVDNAIKFTGNGSITMIVRLGRAPQTIELSIADTGCGIAEEFKGDLFKPHFQQEASIRRPRDGLGLSLFNAKAHARRNLGGDVTLERSETEGPTKGSEFLIRLPMSALDAKTEVPIVGTPPTSSHHHGYSPWADVTLPPTIPAKLARAGTTSPPSRPAYQESRRSPAWSVSRKRPSFNKRLAQDYPLNILIAEDNAINRNVVIGALNKLGYTMENITVAFDGLEAVKHYEDSLSRPLEKHFDAILMDIWMPNMDGYQATQKISQLAKANGEKVTIAAVTADITNESSERAKEYGMQGFLAKPYKVLDIERLIIEHFPKRLEQSQN